MPVKALQDYLDNHHVHYVSSLHSPAFTSQEVAASAHVSGNDLAKVVIVKTQGHMAMVVLPASHKVNFAKLKDAVGGKVDLAAESEFKSLFPGCEVGAMPPFGNLYDMPVFVASEVSQHDQLIFNAGTHAELMQIAYADFERMVKPKVVAM